MAPYDAFHVHILFQWMVGLLLLKLITHSHPFGRHVS